MNPGNLRSILFVLILIFLIRGCYEEVSMEEEGADDTEQAVRVLSFDQIEGVVDSSMQTIYFTLPGDSLTSFAPAVDFHGYHLIRMENLDLVNGQVNDLGKVSVNKPYQIVAEGMDQVDTFSLIFTSFPLIHIRTAEVIRNEPKVPATMVMQYVDRSMASPVMGSFESTVGIEYRGGSAQAYDKKSFGLELWEDKSGKDYSASLLGMSFMEDWILDAMYIDYLRMRNKVSFELWEKLGHIPSEDQRDLLFPGIECRFVEVVINNRYHGLYNLNEKLDPKLLQYDKDQYKIGGVLYKAQYWSAGATRFETYTSEPPDTSYWDGWEQIYPEQYIFWDALDELRKLIVSAEDAVFKSRIASVIDLDNAVDYYLFINVLKAYDNSGKNTFLSRYSFQSRFFIIPWDMDATWGIWWDGTEANSGGHIENQLFTRLMDTNAGGFKDQVLSSWELYREGIFSKDSLLLPFSQYHQAMLKNGAYERENERWEEISIDPNSEYEYVSKWIEARLRFLDDKFDD